MSDNKPPMTVWLDSVGTSVHQGNRTFFGKFHQHSDLGDYGPYVHLKQFMEEVEYRTCRGRFPSAANSSEATGMALYELAKELMEGKS